MPIKRLIIAPAGALIQFPFNRLSVSAGSYLGDYYEITYINTGKELLMQSTGSFAESLNILPGRNAAVFNNPLIIGNPFTTVYPPLPYAEKEAHMAAECLNTVCYTGEDADISLFDLQARQAPTLLHMAVHGVFYNAQNDCPKEAGSQTLSDIPDWNNAFDIMEQSGRLAFSLAVESLRCYEEKNTRPFADAYYWAGYLFMQCLSTNRT